MNIEYKLRVLRFVEKLTEIKSARWLARESGVSISSISRGMQREGGFPTRTHERLVAWIEGVAHECIDEGLPLEIEGIELPLSEKFLAQAAPQPPEKSMSAECTEVEDGGEKSTPQLDESVFGGEDADAESDRGERYEKHLKAFEDVGAVREGVYDHIGDAVADSPIVEEEGTCESPLATEIIQAKAGDLVRCGSCGATWACARCSAEDDGVVELTDADGTVVRYEGVGPEDVVMPPGMSIAKWRPTELYRSPWEDPDWFDNGTVSQDLKVLFGVRMADLIQSRKAAHSDRQPWLMPDPYAGPTEADREIYGDAADVLTEWTHYATAELVMTEVQGYERTNVYRHARMMRLKGEVVLIRQYGMTVPGHEIPWDEFHRREQLDWRLQEIRELAQYFDDVSRPRGGGVFGALRKLFGGRGRKGRRQTS